MCWFGRPKMGFFLRTACLLSRRTTRGLTSMAMSQLGVLLLFSNSWNWALSVYGVGQEEGGRDLGAKNKPSGGGTGSGPSRGSEAIAWCAQMASRVRRGHAAGGVRRGGGRGRRAWAAALAALCCAARSKANRKARQGSIATAGGAPAPPLTLVNQHAGHAVPLAPHPDSHVLGGGGAAVVHTLYRAGRRDRAGQGRQAGRVGRMAGGERCA